MSAPSDTSTTPETGRPASSSRAPSIAVPRRVCAPSKVSSFTAVTRPVDDENRNTRTMKRSASDLRSGLSGAPNWARMKSARGFPAQSAICMLRESSSNTATTFCWLTAARTTSVGRNRQNSTSASAATRREVRTMRSRSRPSFTRTRRYVRTAMSTTMPTRAAAMKDPGGDVEAEFTLLENNRPIRKKRLEQLLQQRRTPLQLRLGPAHPGQRRGDCIGSAGVRV